MQSVELPSIGIQPRGAPSWIILKAVAGTIVCVPFCVFLVSQKGKVRPSEGDPPLVMWVVTCWDEAGPFTRNEPSKRKAGSWGQGQGELRESLIQPRLRRPEPLPVGAEVT